MHWIKSLLLFLYSYYYFEYAYQNKTRRKWLIMSQMFSSDSEVKLQLFSVV